MKAETGSTIAAAMRRESATTPESMRNSIRPGFPAARDAPLWPGL
jgi:hypothetical protein